MVRCVLSLAVVTACTRAASGPGGKPWRSHQQTPESSPDGANLWSNSHIYLGEPSPVAHSDYADYDDAENEVGIYDRQSSYDYRHRSAAPPLLRYPYPAPQPYRQHRRRHVTELYNERLRMRLKRYEGELNAQYVDKLLVGAPALLSTAVHAIPIWVIPFPEFARSQGHGVNRLRANSSPQTVAQVPYNKVKGHQNLLLDLDRHTMLKRNLKTLLLARMPWLKAV